MHTAHISADSEQPSDPVFDTLAVLDLWQAVAEARSQPEAAVEMAHLIARLCNCDCVFLYLDHSDFADCSWPPGLQVSPAFRGDRPSTATGGCRSTDPIGFAVEEPAGTAWIPGAVFALKPADGTVGERRGPLVPASDACYIADPGKVAGDRPIHRRGVCATLAAGRMRNAANIIWPWGWQLSR